MVAFNPLLFPPDEVRVAWDIGADSIWRQAAGGLSGMSMSGASKGSFSSSANNFKSSCVFFLTISLRSLPNCVSRSDSTMTLSRFIVSSCSFRKTSKAALALSLTLRSSSFCTYSAFANLSFVAIEESFYCMPRTFSR